MRQNLRSSQRGQSLVEYALLLVLVALVAVPVVTLFGGGIRSVFQNLFSEEPASSQIVLTEVPNAAATEIPTEAGVVQLTPISTIAQDFMGRIMDYYNTNGKWPRAGGDKRFTDLGLKPGDWDSTVEGVNWDPSGSTIHLSVKKEDNIQMYVNDLNGNKLKVFSNWPIICVPTSGSCYYHTVAPGNEVDVNSVVVEATEEGKKNKD